MTSPSHGTKRWVFHIVFPVLMPGSSMLRIRAGRISTLLQDNMAFWLIMPASLLSNKANKDFQNIDDLVFALLINKNPLLPLLQDEACRRGMLSENDCISRLHWLCRRHI